MMLVDNYLDKLHVILSKHIDIYVIVPWNKTLMSYSS